MPVNGRARGLGCVVRWQQRPATLQAAAFVVARRRTGRDAADGPVTHARPGLPEALAR